MLVLVGCEESQTVCQAFLKAGHDAWSCDLQATRGDPARHMQCDVLEAVSSRMWDLIILHPDCTKMAVSGNRWYGVGMPRNHERLASIEWTKGLWALAKKHAKRAALENPVSVIFSHITEPVQYVQPWMFGHGETKRTGFALHNLPELKPTNVVEGREQRVWKMPPSPTRKRDRSKTYQGIADALAAQWGVAMRLRINSAESLSSAIRKLSEEYRAHKYLVVSYRIGRDRTLDQNSLWFEMYKRIALMSNIGTEQDARKHCKLHLGVTIMCRDDAGFRDGWNKTMRHLPYETQLELMGPCALFGPDGFPVTRLFNRKQGIEYTDSIVAEFAPKGVVFDDLLSDGK